MMIIMEEQNNWFLTRRKLLIQTLMEVFKPMSKWKEICNDGDRWKEVISYSYLFGQSGVQHNIQVSSTLLPLNYRPQVKRCWLRPSQGKKTGSFEEKRGLKIASKKLHRIWLFGEIQIAIFLWAIFQKYDVSNEFFHKKPKYH